MLVLQYGLGMILNFYVGIPAADAHAGIFTEIATAPLALTLHALLGISLIGTAMLLVARAIGTRDRLLAVLAAAGLVAIAGAFVAGEMFVKNGQDGTSFAMAMLTGVALLCYVATLALSTKTRQAPGPETEPLLVSVPAARTGNLENDLDGWGAEPGWDDDPDWAHRLRQDAEPSWPNRPVPPQRPAVRLQHRADWAQRPQPQRPQPPRPQPPRPQPQHRQPQHRQAQGPQPQHRQAQGPPDWWERP